MDKLNVVLTEYNALRDEIIDKFRLHLQIYSIYASALLIFYGLIFVNQKYDLILLTPFLQWLYYLDFFGNNLLLEQ